ncbi:MAG: response regulator [Holophagales bacterium]|jgi:putative two-component system response regulator|nr:response regulator [Holophagales bacterium]
MKKKLMLIDDNTTNLSVGKSALQDTYDVLTVNSGERALQLLEKITPDLILLDVDMPGMDGYETIRRIKANEAMSHIPVIFLTAKDDVNSELDGLSLGAVDYIAKPFSVPLLLKRIELHLLVEEQKNRLEEQKDRLQDFNDNLQKMVEQKTEKIMQLQDIFITTFSELVEFRDEDTGGHIARTQLYLKALAEKMIEKNIYPGAIEAKDIKWLVQSSQLHDVGKINISDHILNKPGKLSPEEFEIMKRHTTIGKEAIAKIVDKVEESEFLKHASIMAFSHHERWDGKGYPLGLAGEEIPIQGRLMAIADVYDALISERSYKPSFTHETAVEIIVAGRGTQFDPFLVDLFQEISTDFYEISKKAV